MYMLPDGAWCAPLTRVCPAAAAPPPQGQLRDKDRRLQALATQLVEAEERGTRLEADLGLARSGWAGVGGAPSAH